MAIEAKLNKNRLSNLKLYLFACLIGGVVLGYDGYLSKYEWSHRTSFYEEHVKDGKLDGTMQFNQKVSLMLFGGAVVLGFYYMAAKQRKLVADETELKISGSDPIPYEKMEQIDKTQFGTKGYFVVTYKDFKDRTTTKTFSKSTYDNLEAVLEQLVAKITA